MQRARRLVAIALLATLGTATLAACQGSPSVAAEIGDKRITERQVDEVYEDIRTKLQRAADAQVRGDASPAPTPSPAATGAAAVQVPVSRAAIVSTYLLSDLCGRLAPPTGGQPVTAAQVAQAENITPDSTYAQLRADMYACLSRLSPGETPPATPAELRAIYDAGIAAGVIPKDVTYEAAVPQLDGEQLRTALATRRLLADEAAKAKITVNPRYRPLSFPVLSFDANTPAVSVPLGEPASDAVLDQD